MSSSEADIRREILALAAQRSEVADALDKYAVEVRDYWRSVSPVGEGDYAASVSIKKLKPVGGLPARRVQATDYKAHWIEFGTGTDDGGERYVARLGKKVDGNTPTPAYAPRAKTAAHFGGDERRIQDVQEAVQEQNEIIAMGQSVNRDALARRLTY